MSVIAGVVQKLGKLQPLTPRELGHSLDSTGGNIFPLLFERVLFFHSTVM